MGQIIQQLLIVLAKSDWKTTLAGATGASATSAIAYAANLTGPEKYIAYVVAGALMLIGYMASDKKSPQQADDVFVKALTQIEAGLKAAAEEAVTDHTTKMLGVLPNNQIQKGEAL
jgi:hypothetical protein